MSEWFYGIGDTQHGPVEEGRFEALIASGVIKPTTLVWREGMPDWIELRVMRPAMPPPIGNPYASPNLGSRSGSIQYYGAPTTTSGLAIASMVCGILGLLTCFVYIPGVCGLAAVICGHLGMNSIRSSPYPLDGRGMCIAGLITGYIAITLQVFMILGFFFVFHRAFKTTESWQF